MKTSYDHSPQTQNCMKCGGTIEPEDTFIRCRERTYHEELRRYFVTQLIYCIQCYQEITKGEGTEP